MRNIIIKIFLLILIINLLICNKNKKYISASKYFKLITFSFLIELHMMENYNSLPDVEILILKKEMSKIIIENLNKYKINVKTKKEREINTKIQLCKKKFEKYINLKKNNNKIHENAFLNCTGESFNLMRTYFEDKKNKF